MNYSKSLTCLVSLVLLILSCSKSEMDMTVYSSEETNNLTFSNRQNKSPQKTGPIRSKNELIIEFKEGLNDDTKKRLRNKFKVVKYKTCNCTNKRIELWEFNDNMDIEGRKGEITQEGVGVEGTDFQYYYETNNLGSDIPNSTQSNSLINSFTSKGASKVTIAILDTGIDLKALTNNDPFLYQSNDNNSCGTAEDVEISGWDFVNNDNDTFDDNGHGTAVTEIMRAKLEDEKIENYQILPVKVFNKLGKGSTFDILCGYLYATSKKVSIMNFSFGWYGAPSNLFKKYISENPNVLHISSAGNSFNDNDILTHYPSTYKHKNIISIGSVGEKITSIANFSNYGKSNVDFLSIGQNVLCYSGYGYSYYVSGTSFAAPLVTALAAKHYSNGYLSPSGIESQLYNNATLLPLRIKHPVKYEDRILE